MPCGKSTTNCTKVKGLLLKKLFTLLVEVLKNNMTQERVK